MVAGTLSGAEYFMGNFLTRPIEGSNPRGFFEDKIINQINEELLARVTPKRLPIVGDYICKHIPMNKQRWLSKVDVGTPILSNSELDEKIQNLVLNRPFCFKDPRFSYTLPVWRKWLNSTRFICVFRDPESTVKSIIEECNTRPYLQNFRITSKHALEVWILMYRHILELHSLRGDWLFIHFDQVLTQQGLDLIEDFIDATVDRSFPEIDLKHQIPAICHSPVASKIYETLCEKSAF
jgi:hypothetical protein